MKKVLTFLPIVLVSFFIVANFALAAVEYVPLVSLDTKNPTPTVTTATGYIKTFLTGFMAVVVAMALFTIVKGGIKLMFAGDNSSLRGVAKTDITQAIYGLVLALMTYTLLYIINPKLIPGEDLFNFQLDSSTWDESFPD